MKSLFDLRAGDITFRRQQPGSYTQQVSVDSRFPDSKGNRANRAGCIISNSTNRTKRGNAGGKLTAKLLHHLAGAFFQLSKGRRFKKERGRTARLLSEIFSKHLGDSSISSEAMEALEAKMGEFLRLSRAVAQSEETLNRLTQDISGLQAREEGCSGQIEEQQRIQLELE